MKKILALPIFISSMTASLSSYAQCSLNPVFQSDSQLPVSLQGRLVYHSYINYNDGSSNLYLKDFSSKTLVQLNQSYWNIQDPMNAHFSSDGTYLTFMGKQNSRWNIFIWRIGSSSAPVNLSKNTDKTGGTSEDPKFSSSGNYIVYKNNGDIALIHLNYSNLDKPFADMSWRLTKDGYSQEESMPYLATDGKSVFYSRGAGAGSDIYRIDFSFLLNQLLIGKPVLVSKRIDSSYSASLAEYYPIVQNKMLYFVSWKNITAKNDQIYSMDTSIINNTPVELSINDCNADNADPTVADTSRLIFSSTRGDAYYHLVLGDVASGNVWSLNQFGVNQAQRNQLGASYTNARPLARARNPHKVAIKSQMQAIK